MANCLAQRAAFWKAALYTKVRAGVAVLIATFTLLMILRDAVLDPKYRDRYLLKYLNTFFMYEQHELTAKEYHVEMKMFSNHPRQMISKQEYKLTTRPVFKVEEVDSTEKQHTTATPSKSEAKRERIREQLEAILDEGYKVALINRKTVYQSKVDRYSRWHTKAEGFVRVQRGESDVKHFQQSGLPVLEEFLKDYLD
jgi:hypothetical protein